MLLSIDTSTEWIGIALFNGTNVLAEQTWRSKNYHTVELIPAIKEMLTKTHTKTSSLTGVGVALGPGSFTGLRIGLSAAKGIALGRNLPVAGIPSLEILAAAQPAYADPCSLSWRSVGAGAPSCVININKAPGKHLPTSLWTIFAQWLPPLSLRFMWWVR